MQENSNDLHFLHSRFESPSNNEGVDLKPLTSENIFCNIVGNTSPMKNLYKKIGEMSRNGSGALIEGSPGVGKKLVARAIHQLSHGDWINMISVNCTTVQDDWFEREIFGENGQLSKLREGTFFFEEVGELPLRFQERCLKLMEAKSFSNIRLLASSCHDLKEKMRTGAFDERFFQHIGEERIRVPSLDERKEDIALLLVYFFEKYSGTPRGLTVHEQAYRRLLSYNWPGNVRELENLVEQWAALKGNGMIKSGDLPEKFFQERTEIIMPPEGIDLKKVLSDMEDSLIRQALKMTGDNKNRASKLLRINRTTLIEKMKKKGMNLA